MLTNPTIALLESLRAAAALIDGSGRIMAVNSAWTNFGPGNPLLEGHGVGTDYHALCAGLGHAADGHLSLVALGLLSVMEGRVPRIQLDYHHSAGGERRWYGTIAFHPEPPNEVAAVVHHIEITDRARVEHRLRKGEALFKAITNHSLDLMAILRADGHFVYRSPSFSRILAFPPDDFPAEGMEALLHEEDLPLFRSVLQQARKSGLSRVAEFRLRRYDGTWCPVEGQASVVDQAFDEGESILLVSRDITARKEAEAEQAQLEIQLRQGQKMEAIGQLAAGIAHEINTPTQFLSDNARFLQEAYGALGRVFAALLPLARAQSRPPDPSGALDALAELMDREDIPYFLEEVPRALAQSREGLERIATIVRAMKVFSHPSSESRTPVDLNQALETTLVVAANEWKYVADVTRDLDPELPMISGFPGELNQAFLNLVVNAAHAIADVVGTGGAKGRIMVATRRVGDHVEVEIADTGTGIPKEIQGRIFEPFFTTKAVGKGTGQGLSVVHSVVAKHGGTIGLESEPGRGTRFTLRFPVPPPA